MNKTQNLLCFSSIDIFQNLYYEVFKDDIFFAERTFKYISNLANSCVSKKYIEQLSNIAMDKFESLYNNSYQSEHEHVVNKINNALINIGKPPKTRSNCLFNKID